MNTPKEPTLEESLEYLRGMQQFQVVIKTIAEGREELIGAFKSANPEQLLKLSGEIYAHDNLLGLLRG